MSIRFPTDNDAGMSRPSAPRRPGGGGKLFSLLIIGVIAFMAVRWMSPSGPSTPVDPNPSDRSGEIGSTESPEFKTDQLRVDDGDWGMGDGPVQQNAESKKPNPISNGDWGAEEVATQSRSASPNSELKNKKAGIDLVFEGPSNVEIGDSASFLLRIKNDYDQPLKNVQIEIAYDSGLVRPGRLNPAKFRLAEGSLKANQSEAFPFVVTAKALGKQSLRVKFSADGILPKLHTAQVNVSKAGTGIASKGEAKATQGDWSMDLNPEETPKKTTPKKTTKGDWGLEEVE